MTDTEIAWLAGLLEGEGCFGFDRVSPFVKVAMTDRDIIEKVKRITICSGNVCWRDDKNRFAK